MSKMKNVFLHIRTKASHPVTPHKKMTQFKCHYIFGSDVYIHL